MINKRELASAPNPAEAGITPLPTGVSPIRPARRGKHKIFIGMAPGVGKTYRMLEEAHLLKHEGIDVVIGVVETHGRKETAQKAQGPGNSATPGSYPGWVDAE